MGVGEAPLCTSWDGIRLLSHLLTDSAKRHWFRLMSDTHERFCWTTRLCRVMLLHRGICLSLGGDYDFDPYAVSLL
jgi:hypothetical protein